MLCLSTECCVKRAHPQHVDVVAIQKIAFIEDDHLETDVHSVSIGMNAVDCHEVLRGPLVWIVPILVRYHVSFSTDVIPQLQLWHLHWLMSIQSVGDLHSQVLRCYTSCLTETLLQSLKHINVCMMSTRIT
jgi:hypothetical protein